MAKITTTALSGALYIGARIVLGTLFTDGAFRTLDGHVIGGVTLDTPFASQRKVVNGLKHAGSANFRAGSFALDSIRRQADTTLAQAIVGKDRASVLDHTSKADREAMLASIVGYYELESVAQAA